jgi:hypothetical protein
MNLKNLDTIRAIRNVVRMIAILFFIMICLSLIFGCAEIPDREMDEHFMSCIMLDDNEAFCS